MKIFKIVFQYSILVFSWIVFCLGTGFFAVSCWIWYHFGFMKWQELICNMAHPIGSVPYKYVYSSLIVAILFFITFILFSYWKRKFFKKYALVFAGVGLGIFCILSYSFRLPEFLSQWFVKATLYEDEYIASDIQPNNRNLIVFMIESYEKTFQNKELFGENLIPSLSKIQKENLTIYGFHQLEETYWTLSSMAATFCGSPQKLNYAFSLFDRNGIPFLMPCWPEQLQQAGYHTVLMKSANIRFSQADEFALQHGFSEALGFEELRKYSDEDQSGWGLNDRALFTAVKDKLQELSQSDKPFMLSFIQVDTHQKEGYLPQYCAEKYGDFRDVIKCTDSVAGDLIRWIQAQPFYQNTTVVIMGDHLLPHSTIDSFLKKASDREIYFTILNPTPQQQFALAHRTHLFSNLDVGATILDAVGFKFNGKYGLGRSVFREEKTLYERKGDHLSAELNAFSAKYDEYCKDLFQEPQYLQQVSFDEKMVFSASNKKKYIARGFASFTDNFLQQAKDFAEIKFNIGNQSQPINVSFSVLMPFYQSKTGICQLTVSIKDKKRGEWIFSKENQPAVQFTVLPEDITDGILSLQFHIEDSQPAPNGRLGTYLSNVLFQKIP